MHSTSWGLWTSYNDINIENVPYLLVKFNNDMCLRAFAPMSNNKALGSNARNGEEISWPWLMQGENGQH
jgi:hypothetical protein